LAPAADLIDTGEVKLVHLAVALGMGGLLARPSIARADGSDVAATALFDEGRRLMAAHRYADACPKLEESERLGPSGGTLLNLAECYEHTGQTASSWVAWKDAAARANAAGKTQVEKTALARAAALEPGLARLMVAVAPDSDVPGLVIERDGEALGRAEYGLSIPVDPGRHRVQADAPHKKHWSLEIDVAPKQTDARVTVTLVDDAIGAAPLSLPPPVEGGALATPPDAEARGGASVQRSAAWVTLGAGVAGVAVGSVFGLMAKSKNDEALQPQNCQTSTLCTRKGLALTDDAKSAATVSTVAFVAGGVALAAGAVLWLTAPSHGALRIAPAVGGAILAGAF
jgi:hypothetical protein